MITAEQVLEAYKETGIKPIRKRFRTVIDDKQCGCAATALAVKHGFDFTSSLEIDSFIKRKLDINHDDLWAFISGFDSEPDTLFTRYSLVSRRQTNMVASPTGGVSMNQIQPTEIVESYKKCGIEPTKGFWFRVNHAGIIHCGCAITAYLMAQHPPKFEIFKDMKDHGASAGEFFDFLSNNIPYTKEYIRGFVHGYDGFGESSTETEYNLGYADGIAAWRLVFKELI